MNTIEAAKPIYYSTRIRLTADQREQLKEAYYKAKASHTPEPMPTRGGISVTTNYSYDPGIGIGDIAMKDLLSTRESISIAVILRLQTRLGIEIISKKELEKSFKEYLEYIYSDDFTKR